MDQPPVDLTPLDPARDPARWEAAVARVMARAAGELERRAAPPSPILLLAGWMRPTLAAALAVAVLSLGVLARSGPDEPALARTGVAEELGLPDPVEAWVAEARAPTREDLIVALEREMP